MKKFHWTPLRELMMLVIGVALVIGIYIVTKNQETMIDMMCDMSRVNDPTQVPHNCKEP